MSDASRAERLFLAIGGVDDALVQQAVQEGTPRQPAPWIRWGAMAAALLLVAGAGLWRFPRLGGAAGSAGQKADNAAPGAMEFLSYAGPVLPLTVLEGPEDLPAGRTVTWDFGAGEEARSLYQVEVTDETVISNTAAETVTIRLAYPVPADLNAAAEELPALTVNGGDWETTLLWGDTGGLWESPVLHSYEGYRALLEDGSYLAAAGEAAPVLEQTVTVWEFTDTAAPDWDPNKMAPTLAVTFRIDEAETQVFSYGFNGLSGKEDGTRRYDYFVSRAGETEGRRLLVFLGEAPEGYTMAGYTNGGCDTPLAGVTARITAVTTTLGELLDQLVEDNITTWRQELSHRSAELKTAVRRLAAGLLGREERRLDNEMLEELVSHAVAGTRIVWTTAEVTIPAGDSVTVTICYRKKASFDYACASTKNQGRYGFDLATGLGSNLRFTTVTARLENAGRVQVEEQDMGFPLSGETAEAALDPAQEHYYMILRLREG